MFAYDLRIMKIFNTIDIYIVYRFRFLLLMIEKLVSILQFLEEFTPCWQHECLFVNKPKCKKKLMEGNWGLLLFERGKEFTPFGRYTFCVVHLCMGQIYNIYITMLYFKN